MIASLSMFWLLPGLGVLYTQLDWSLAKGAPRDGAPQWIVVLVGLPFLLFGVLLLALATHVYRATSWRRTVFAFFVIMFPLITAIAAWPLCVAAFPRLPVPMVAGSGSPAELVLAALIGIPFGCASVVLWYSVATGRVTSENVRGMTEHDASS